MDAHSVHTIEVDPLSNYDYHGYRHYAPIPIYNPSPVTSQSQYPFDVKMEPIVYPPMNQTDYPQPQFIPPYNAIPENEAPRNNVTNENAQPNYEPARNPEQTYQPEQPDYKFDLSFVKKERNGKTFKSNMSAKIQEADYPFYCCAVCNITYKSLIELDQHVVVHADRITSYDLRIKRQLQKKQKKQEQKKIKKRMKREIMEPEIEIKPEDGYIGNETAAEFNLNTESGTFEPNTNNGVTDAVAMETSSSVAIEKSTSVAIETSSSVAMETSSSGAIETSSSVAMETSSSVAMETDPATTDSKTVTETNEKAEASTDKSVTDSQKPTNSESKPNNQIEDKRVLHTRFEKKYKQVYSILDRQSLLNLEKIYKCYACNKQFTLSYYLKLHVRSHTDEKPYTCAVCGESFITASKLGRHNKRIHLNIRHQCRICYRYFSRFEVLTKHFDKKHPDDKIEGEPYDYNAIVPYLKELEEELREKKESEKKMKVEDPWFDAWAAAGMDPDHMGLMGKEPKEENEEDCKKYNVIDIPIEEVKVDIAEIEIKEEKPDTVEDWEGVKDENDCGDNRDDSHSVAGDVPKEENSDEDYFPSETWVTAPKLEIEPPSPTDAKRSKRGAKKCLTCDICKKKLSSFTYLKVHMRTHTGERPYKCHVCSRGFITSSKMHRHVLSKHAEGETTEAIEEGVKSENETKNNDELQNAKAKFKKKKKKLSKLDRTRKREHACEFCNKRFKHIETLEIHKVSHKGESRVHKCNFCLMEQDSEEALRAHEASHAGAKPYTCTVCGKGYKKRETMIYHKKQHAPDKDFPCALCNRMFNAQSKLQRHMLTHRTNKFTYRYECPVCAHMFNTKYHMQMHLNTHQKEGLILEENRNEILAMVLQNARKIPKQTGVAPPAEEIQADERSRVCNICGEVFQHFFFLEEHLKSHGTKLGLDDADKPEERKYVCEICNKGFKLHYYLKLHSFTHNKVRPFICQQCGKGFITKGKLKRHLETHAGLKKYQCHICYKFFTRPSYLRIHVRTIHGTQDYNFRVEKDQVNSYSVNSLSSMSEYSV